MKRSTPSGRICRVRSRARSLISCRWIRTKSRFPGGRLREYQTALASPHSQNTTSAAASRDRLSSGILRAAPLPDIPGDRPAVELQPRDVGVDELEVVPREADPRRRPGRGAPRAPRRSGRPGWRRNAVRGTPQRLRPAPRARPPGEGGAGRRGFRRSRDSPRPGAGGSSRSGSRCRRSRTPRPPRASSTARGSRARRRPAASTRRSPSPASGRGPPRGSAARGG